MVWVWPAGLRFLWRSERPTWRAVAWAYGLLFVIFMLTTGKQIYYLAGVYVTLLAAGAVSVDGWLHERPVRLRWLAVATAVTALVPVLVVLPVLPAPDVGWTYNLSAVSGESIGWPQLVSIVRASCFGTWSFLETFMCLAPPHEVLQRPGIKDAVERLGHKTPPLAPGPRPPREAAGSGAVAELAVNLAREVTLQAADDLFAGQSFFAAAVSVAAGGRLSEDGPLWARSDLLTPAPAARREPRIPSGVSPNVSASAVCRCQLLPSLAHRMSSPDHSPRARSRRSACHALKPQR